MIMAIQDSDLFLINRAGASYQVRAAQLKAKMTDSDLMLVNRNGVSYKADKAAVFGNEPVTLQDTDLLMINRGSASYKVTGDEFNTYFNGPIIISPSRYTWSNYISSITNEGNMWDGDPNSAPTTLQATSTSTPIVLTFNPPIPTNGESVTIDLQMMTADDEVTLNNESSRRVLTVARTTMQWDAINEVNTFSFLITTSGSKDNQPRLKVHAIYIGNKIIKI